LQFILSNDLIVIKLLHDALLIRLLIRRKCSLTTPKMASTIRLILRKEKMETMMALAATNDSVQVSAYAVPPLPQVKP